MASGLPAHSRVRGASQWLRCPGRGGWGWQGGVVIHIALGPAVLVLGLVLGGIPAAWALTRRLRRAAASATAHHAAFMQSPGGMLLVDAVSLRIVDANPALQRSLGIELPELLELPLGTIFTAEDGGEPQALISQLREATSRLLVEAGQRCRSGRFLHVEISGHRLELGDRTLFSLATRDITLRRRVEAQQRERQRYLDHLAHHDQLTGLPNRLYLAAHLPQAIERAKQAAAMLAVLFLDLDRFKHINDSRGHDTGDKLLQEVARRIRGCVRAEDMVVRMGGDEFIVVLRNVIDSNIITDTAGRLAEALNDPVVIDGRPLVTTASIGVSLYPRDGLTMGELLRQSDTAMYQAKDRGRNNFQLFTPGMERKLKERVAIENGLRAALKNRRLQVHYQPIVHIESRRVVALEALLRWRPSQGYVRPGRFVTIAEETGLIVPIGEFVAQRAVRDITRWREEGAAIVPVAVNVSAAQLQRSDYPAFLAGLLSKHAVGAELLQIELTESALFERQAGHRTDPTQQAIARLRELGTRIAIDDFGTGYSSLSYLRRSRVDALKIDRSFVRDLVMNLGDLAIVEAIIAMARHLHIEVVAEGIESWQQLEKLRQLRCDLAQGFLLAKPAPADQCRRFLTGEPLDFIAQDSFNDVLEMTRTG